MKRPVFLSNAPVPLAVLEANGIDEALDYRELFHESFLFVGRLCWNLTLLQFPGLVGKLDPPPLQRFVSVGSIVASTTHVRDIMIRGSPKSKLREVQRQKYDPTEANEWSGSKSLPQLVSAHVQENPSGTTLVLAGPSGKVKRRLLDNMFRGQKSTIAPYMGGLSLSEALPMDLGLLRESEADALGLDELGRLMKDVTNPPRFPLDHFFSRSTTRPFVCIVRVPWFTTTRSDAAKVLTQASMLQEAGGKSAITIVCLRDSYGIFKPPLVNDESKFSVVRVRDFRGIFKRQHPWLDDFE